MEQQQQEQRQQEPPPPPSSSSEPFADHQHASRFGSSLTPPSLTPRQYARRRWSQQQRERQPVCREVIGYAVGMHTSPPVPIAAQDAAGAAQANDQGLLLEHTLYVVEKSLVNYNVGGRRTRSSTRGGEQQEARVIYQQRVLLRVAAAPAPAAQQITGADDHDTPTLISYGDGTSDQLAIMQAELLTVEAMADDVQDQDAALLLAEQVARLAGQIVREEDPGSQRVALFLMHVRLMGQVAAASGADEADEEAAQVDADYTDEFRATAAPGRNPPASMAVIDALPELQFTHDHHHGDHKDQEQWISSSMADNICCVCSDELLHAVCTQLPCKHLFHKKCIAQWLHMRNTCPLCRFELPTDNPTYEANKRRRLH